jgi:hypothetical protein
VRGFIAYVTGRSLELPILLLDVSRRWLTCAGVFSDPCVNMKWASRRKFSPQVIGCIGDLDAREVLEPSIPRIKTANHFPTTGITGVVGDTERWSLQLPCRQFALSRWNHSISDFGDGSFVLHRAAETVIGS